VLHLSAPAAGLLRLAWSVAQRGPDPAAASAARWPRPAAAHGLPRAGARPPPASPGSRGRPRPAAAPTSACCRAATRAPGARLPPRPAADHPRRREREREPREDG